MQRRTFLGKSILVAGGAALAGCTAGCTGGSNGDSAGAPAVQTRPRVRWKLASSFPRSLDTIFGAADVLCQRVADLTDGRFEIRAYASGEIVPAFEVLEAVQQNTVPVGHTACYYFTGKNPALAFDTAVPFGLGARQQLAWMREGGRELIDELLSDFGVRSLPGGNTGVQMGGWFRQPFGSLAELQGLKMRIPGLGGEVMKRLGVTPMTLPGGEIYQALELGNIDATEWVGPYDDRKLDFHQVAKHYYYPGWWEPGPALTFIVNQGAWTKLPSDYQAALATAASEAGVGMMSQYDARNPAALKQLVDDGVQLHPFPRDVMEAARRETDAFHEEQAAQNPSYRKVLDHWRAFRDLSNRWFATAEHSYASFVYGSR